MHVDSFSRGAIFFFRRDGWLPLARSSARVSESVGRRVRGFVGLCVLLFVQGMVYFSKESVLIGCNGRALMSV